MADDEVRVSDVLYKWFTSFKLSNMKSNHLIMIQPKDCEFIMVFTDEFQLGMSYRLFKYFKHRGYEYVDQDRYQFSKKTVFTTEYLDSWSYRRSIVYEEGTKYDFIEFDPTEFTLVGDDRMLFDHNKDKTIQKKVYDFICGHE